MIGLSGIRAGRLRRARWKRQTVRCVATLSAALAASCVRYQPSPLDPPAEQTLAGPDLARVYADAARLSHPIVLPRTIDPSGTLTPDDAAVLAVLVNPGLKAARSRRGVAQAQLFSARLLSDPQASGSTDKPFAGPTQGSSTALGMGVSWDLLALVTRRERVSAVENLAKSVDLDVAWQEWQTAQAARISAYRVLLIQSQLETTATEADTLKDSTDRIKTALDLAEATIIDYRAVQSAYEIVQQDLLALRRELGQERQNLNAILGLAPEYPLKLHQRGWTLEGATLPTLEAAMEDLQRKRLDLLALRMGYESQDATLRAAIKTQFVPVNIGLNLARDTGRLWTLGGAVTFAFPLLGGQRGNIRVEGATREQLRQEYAARVFEARSEIAALLENLHWVMQQHEAATRTVATQEQLVDVAGIDLKEGNTDVLSYYNLVNDLVRNRLDVIVFRRAWVELSLALETASGRYWPSLGIT